MPPPPPPPNVGSTAHTIGHKYLTIGTVNQTNVLYAITSLMFLCKARSLSYKRAPEMCCPTLVGSSLKLDWKDLPGSNIRLILSMRKLPRKRFCNIGPCLSVGTPWNFKMIDLFQWRKLTFSFHATSLISRSLLSSNNH